MPQFWTPEDIPWDQFDPSKVDPEILKIVKAASMVESNGRDYAEYLCNVFTDDPEFQECARDWAEEEVQHGVVLGRWAAMADPDFNYDEALARFRDGYRISTEVDASVRGSRSGELVARCMVEVGTSSYYAALGDATDEPALKVICKKIAADELRHYRTFYKNMRRYLDVERLNKLQRLKVALGRIAETEDDELAYAYYAANSIEGEYDRKAYSRAYASRAFKLYRTHHIERAIAMVFKAVGFTPNGWASRTTSRTVARLMKFRVRRMAAA